MSVAETMAFINSNLNVPLNALINAGRRKLFTEDGTWTVPDGITEIMVSGCGSGKGRFAGQAMVRELKTVVPGEVISFTVGMDEEAGYKDTIITSESLGEIVLYAGTLSDSVPNEILGIPLGIAGGNGAAGGAGYNSANGIGVAGSGGYGGIGGVFGIGGGGAGGGGGGGGQIYTGSVVNTGGGGGGGAGGFSTGSAGSGGGESSGGAGGPVAPNHPLGNNAGQTGSNGSVSAGGKGGDAGNGCWYGAGGGGAGNAGTKGSGGAAGTGGSAGKPSGGMVMFEW